MSPLLGVNSYGVLLKAYSSCHVFVHGGTRKIIHFRWFFPYDFPGFSRFLGEKTHVFPRKSTSSTSRLALRKALHVRRRQSWELCAAIAVRPGIAKRLMDIQDINRP